jgi:site-specific recombinase XerD
MEVCAADPRPQGLRDAAIIGILYGSGMRKSESVDLDLNQVDFTERSLCVTAKGNKQLIKYAPAWAFAKLDAWLELRRSQLKEGERRHLSVQPHTPRQPHHPRAHYQACDLLHRPPAGRPGGVKIMPHDFRRSFITRVIEEHDLSIAQKLAHHSNIQTTANYDVRDDNERRRAVDRFDL